MGPARVSLSGRVVAYCWQDPATVISWHAPCCFAAATGSDDDRPPVAELPARIRRSDCPATRKRRDGIEADEGSQTR